MYLENLPKKINLKSVSLKLRLRGLKLKKDHIYIPKR